MATGADWMSAASFIGMAGTLYLAGLRRPGVRHGLDRRLLPGGAVPRALPAQVRPVHDSRLPRRALRRQHRRASIGIFAAILCSFTYVVAQIYGVGLITTRFTGVEFELGVFLGLGGILVCSFLGGMRAVTWTQVAQYIILIIAYMIPVVWLSVKHTGIPVPQLVYGQHAREGHRAREEAHQGSEGARGPRHLQGRARPTRRREAEGRRQVATRTARRSAAKKRRRS